MDRRCLNCKWYYEKVCCNGDSEHRADFRLKDETCEEWEERNEICNVKHSPEVV